MSKNNGRYWKGKHLSKESKLKLSLSKKGKVSPNKGKKAPWVTKRNLENNPTKNPEVKEKIRQAMKNNNHKSFLGKKHTEETKLKWSLERKGKTAWNKNRKSNWVTKRNLENNPTKNPEVKEKIRQALIKNRKEGKYNIKPTNPEKILLGIIKENNSPFIYVGDGKFWIDRFNPDFINKEDKLIIEVFGDYWHNLPKIIERDKERLKAYSFKGYKTLIIWEHELQNVHQVLNKIGDFLCQKSQ
jgi:G:T-mismatch repair DNA endonuclease (very short patch repair protein)